MTELDPEAFMDDAVLERELRQAMKSDEEIDLFKILQENLRVKHELANSPVIGVILRDMWQNVADFFDEICSVETIAALQPDHDLVIRHARMRANFDAVAAINKTFKEADAAADELETRDLEGERFEDQ